MGSARHPHRRPRAQMSSCFPQIRRSSTCCASRSPALTGSGAPTMRRHAADLMVAAGNAVLLIDSSLADQDTRGLVTEVHEQFPDLAIIVAGRRDDEARPRRAGLRGHHLPLPAQAGFRGPHPQLRGGDTAPPAEIRRRPSRSGAAPDRHDFGQAEGARAALDGQAGRAGMRRWSRRSLLLIPLILVVVLFATWRPWEKLGDLAPADFQRPADGGRCQPRRRGQEAARRGRASHSHRASSSSRPNENALELYRAVLARDPDNRIARTGHRSRCGRTAAAGRARVDGPGPGCASQAPWMPRALPGPIIRASNSS